MADDIIRLPRSALTDDLWRDTYTARLYFYLVSKADESGRWKVSFKEIQRDIGLSRQQYRIALERLVTTALITASTTASATTVTLDISANKRKSKTASTTASATTVTTTPKPLRFIPPTDEEVTAYVAEKGYHFNPAEFVPFYQMRGWKMKGGEPMKDWKAGCRYWETNWKQKHGERFYYEIQQQQQLARPSFSRQADRYSELERAADTVLFNAPYGNPTQNDRG